MRPQPKPKTRLAEERLVELWNKIGIASLILRDGRQVEVHDGRFVVTVAGAAPSAGAKPVKKVGWGECASKVKCVHILTACRRIKAEV